MDVFEVKLLILISIDLYTNKNDNIHKNEVQDIRRSDEY